MLVVTDSQVWCLDGAFCERERDRVRVSTRAEVREVSNRLQMIVAGSGENVVLAVVHVGEKEVGRERPEELLGR